MRVFMMLLAIEDESWLSGASLKSFVYDFYYIYLIWSNNLVSTVIYFEVEGSLKENKLELLPRL